MIGVEIRPNSLRLRFTFEGRACYPTLMTNGVPMAPTPANIRYAERLAAEVRERIRLGTFSMAEYFPAAGTSGVGMTFGRQLDTWLAAQRIEHSTRAGYESAIKFWKAALVEGEPLGDKAVRALKLSDLLMALATKPKLSGKTVNNYVSVAREALALAVADKLLQANPADGVPRAKWQKEPPDPFTVAEVEAIVADMLAHYPEPVGNFVEAWAFTGLRPSEVVAVQWPQVDLASGYVRVQGAIVRGVEKDTTKTAVTRDVMLNARAAAAYQRQRKHTQVAGGYVWLDPRYGEPWLEERAFRRSYWTPTLKRLGIRYRSQRNLRHTYATMLLMSPAGRKPAFCAGQMGHSIEMFLRVYAKWIKTDQDQLEVEAFDRWLTRPLPGTGAGCQSS